MSERVELLVSREEAEEKLNKQVEKAKAFFRDSNNVHDDLIRLVRGSVDISSAGNYEELRKEYERWNMYNISLLKTIFSEKYFIQENYIKDRDDFMSAAWGVEGAFSERLISIVKVKINRIEGIIGQLELLPDAKKKHRMTKDKTKIFIVHGHDELVKTQVARFIEKLGFEAIILHEQNNQGMTIIEKIEHYSDVGFGIVLYTPCDVGASKSDKDNLNGRARQNVVFEHGYLIGKLRRANVAAMVKGNIEKPNDISGVVYISMDDNSWKYDLAKEMRVAGYNADANKI